MDWRLIIDQSSSGQMNMAVDEAILTSVIAGQSNPTLRIYTWSPVCASIGYFQNEKTALNTKVLQTSGFDIIRRPTGGRARLHYDDISFSIIAPLDFLGKNVFPLYVKIATAIAVALKNIGIGTMLSFRRTNELIDPEFFSSKTPDEIAEIFEDKADSYHESSAPYDILSLSEQRILGLTQTRRNGVLLQQGSVAYSFDCNLIMKTIKMDDKSIKAFKEKNMCLVDANVNLEKEAFVNSLINEFSKELGINFEKGTLSSLENISLKYLVEKYSRSSTKK